MLLGAASDKLAKYTAGGNTMKHEAGKDGVQMAMFVVGAVKSIGTNASKIAELDEVVAKLDEVADGALTKINDAIDVDAGKSISKTIKEGTPANFLEYESQTLKIAKNKKGSKLSQAETDQLIAREKAFVEEGNLGEIAGSSSTLPDGTLEYIKGTKGGWNKELNKPLKTNSKYKIGKNTYETDAQGRVTNAKGELDLNTAERNGYQQRKGVTSKDGDVATDQGGHLIAAIFDGAGEQINYVPMLQSLNQGAWKSMENTWKTARDAGKKVEVDIKIIYGDALKPKRPTSFEIDTWLDGVKQNPKIFSN